MTHNYPPASTPAQRGESFPRVSAEDQGPADLVKGQASDLGQGSIEAGKHVADVAREQASDVAAEAGRQGTDLLRRAEGSGLGWLQRGSPRFLVSAPWRQSS